MQTTARVHLVTGLEAQQAGALVCAELVSRWLLLPGPAPIASDPSGPVGTPSTSIGAVAPHHLWV